MKYGKDGENMQINIQRIVINLFLILFLRRSGEGFQSVWEFGDAYLHFAGSLGQFSKEKHGSF